MDALSRLIKKIEHRQLNRSLDSILYKLEGDLVWEDSITVNCRMYDRDGQVVVECDN